MNCNNIQIQKLMKNSLKYLYFYSGILFFIVLLAGCQHKTNVRIGSEKLNNEAAQGKPYLLLISLDGYRWDYKDRFQPPNLTAFVEEGIEAAAMIPCFPSKTFPNHYSIATGM